MACMLTCAACADGGIALLQVVQSRVTRASLFAAVLFCAAFVFHAGLFTTLLSSDAYSTARWPPQIHGPRVGVGLIAAIIASAFDIATALVIFMAPKFCAKVAR